MALLTCRLAPLTVLVSTQLTTSPARRLRPSVTGGPGPWHGYPVPAMRCEAVYGDRVVRCFAERPPNLNAMFAATLAAHGAREAMVFEGRRWTWRELDAEVVLVAAGFAAGGVLRLLGQKAFEVVALALELVGRAFGRLDARARRRDHRGPAPARSAVAHSG